VHLRKPSIERNDGVGRLQNRRPAARGKGERARTLVSTNQGKGAKLNGMRRGCRGPVPLRDSFRADEWGGGTLESGLGKEGELDDTPVRWRDHQEVRFRGGWGRGRADRRRRQDPHQGSLQLDPRARQGQKIQWPCAKLKTEGER